jgi:hypothetical protein
MSVFPLVAELNSTRLCGCQCRVGALGDHAPLLLSDHGHDVHRKSVGVRHVGGHEVNASLFKTRVPVEAGPLFIRSISRLVDQQQP